MTTPAKRIARSIAVPVLLATLFVARTPPAALAAVILLPYAMIMTGIVVYLLSGRRP